MLERDRDTLKKLAAEHTEIKKWLRVHRESFSKAIGMWTDDDDMILMLAKMVDFTCGHFPMHKGDIDRASCNAITSCLRKQPVDAEELRLAVTLLVQKSNAAYERIHQLESVLARMKHVNIDRRTPHPIRPRPQQGRSEF